MSFRIVFKVLLRSSGFCLLSDRLELHFSAFDCKLFLLNCQLHMRGISIVIVSLNKEDLFRFGWSFLFIYILYPVVLSFLNYLSKGYSFPYMTSTEQYSLYFFSLSFLTIMLGTLTLCNHFQC